MARKKPNRRKRSVSSPSRTRSKTGSRVHGRSAASGAYVVRKGPRAGYKVKKARRGRAVPVRSGGATSADPWPRYPLFDSGDPTFSERAEEELAGFGER